MGNFTLTVVATDNGNGNPLAALTGQQQFVVAVPSSNPAPVLNPVGNKIAIVGQPLSFAVQASDLDQDALTFSATGLPAGALFAATGPYGAAASPGRRPWPIPARTRLR